MPPVHLAHKKGQSSVGNRPAHEGAASDELQYQNDQQDYHEHGYYQAYGAVHAHLPSRQPGQSGRTWVLDRGTERDKGRAEERSRYKTMCSAARSLQ